jgi:WD40 repeat protein
MLYAHNDNVMASAFHPTGAEIAYYYFNGQIRLINTENLRVKYVFQPEERTGSSLLYSPDGQLLASGTSNYERKIYVWNTLTGEMVASFPISGGYSVYPKAFTSDSRYLFVVAPSDGNLPSNLVIIDLVNNTISAAIEVDGIIGDLAISPDDTSLIVDVRERTSSGDLSNIQLWNIAKITTEERVQAAWEYDSALRSIDFVTNQELIYEQVDYDCTTAVALFDIEDGTTTILNRTDGNQWVNSLYAPALNADRTLLAAATQTSITFWDLNTMHEIYSIDTRQIVSLTFSADGRSLLSVHGATVSDEIILWRIPFRGE